MGKYGINVPKGVAVASLDALKKAIQDVLPNQNEVVRSKLYLLQNLISLLQLRVR